MQGESRNIYKTSRRAAGLTQEAAAERLGICVESLRAYETGQRIPPNDVVEHMVVQYNAIPLAYQHLQETNSLMARVVPQLEQRSLIQMAVRIANRVRRFEDAHGLDRLMIIAEDDYIDDSERPEFNSIMADLREILKSGLELDIFCGGDNGE